MKFSLYLIILSVFWGTVGADTPDSRRYVLPPSKVHIESCERDALTLHPGMIEVQRELHSDGNFWMLYQISVHDGSEWVVLCDLASGKIIRDEQEFSDDSPLEKEPVQ